MRRKVYVKIPECPRIEAFVLIGKPDVIYINLSCKRKGITMVVSLTHTSTTKGEIVQA